MLRNIQLFSLNNPYLADRRESNQCNSCISWFKDIKAFTFLSRFLWWFQQLWTIFCQFSFQQTQMVFGSCTRRLERYNLSLYDGIKLLTNLCFSGYEQFPFQFPKFFQEFPFYVLYIYILLKPKWRKTKHAREYQCDNQQTTERIFQPRLPFNSSTRSKYKKYSRLFIFSSCEII